MIAGPLTRCYRCGQCTDAAALVPPLKEWLCLTCTYEMLRLSEGEL